MDVMALGDDVLHRRVLPWYSDTIAPASGSEGGSDADEVQP